MGNFYDNSKGKVGKQKLNCNLKCMEKIKFDWLRLDINENRLRILLKETFFTYQNSHDEATSKYNDHDDNYLLLDFKSFTFYLLYICHCGQIRILKS